jgi:hypothetical protein
MTTAALGATARPANSTVVCECAPCNVIQERTVMQERRRCPVGAARVVVTATFAIRQTTPAQTTASVRGIVPAPTSPLEAGPASPAPKFLEVRPSPRRHPRRVFPARWGGARGATWTKRTAPQWSWRSVVSAADGTKLVAVSMVDSLGGGFICTSTDSAPIPNRPPTTRRPW